MLDSDAVVIVFILQVRYQVFGANGCTSSKRNGLANKEGKRIQVLQQINSIMLRT